MTLPAPTIVHRTPLLPEASRLAAHLRGEGIHAELAPDDIAGPLGASPVPGPIHCVVVSDCTTVALMAAVDSFASFTKVDTDSKPFCYHCGEWVESVPTDCPACGEQIETEPVAETDDG